MYNNFEKILCAAIWINDNYNYIYSSVKTGFIVCGRRHQDCWLTFISIRKQKGLSEDDIKLAEFDKDVEIIDGFLTSKGKFVNRKEAVNIALKSGQIKHKKNILVSEDLY